MNDPEELKRLQEELQLLRRQVVQQHAQILQLQARVQKLQGNSEPAASRGLAGLSLENFIGLRLIHLVGIVVLVIGLSIGVKYAIDKNLISEGLRIGLAYTAGILLFLLSVKLKKNYNLFSAILLSGGMASLYFTTYGAHVYYGMMPFALAFALMVALTLFTVWQALVYNRQEIALLGLVGAYGIPFLISKNADAASQLFLYVSLINAGVVYLSIKRPWYTVGRVALGITWVLYLSWASLRYAPQQLGMGLFFLLLFFAMFCVNALKLAWVKRDPLPYNDLLQLLANHLALYIGALLLFYNRGDDASAWVTLVLALLIGLGSFLFHRYWSRSAVQQPLANLAFVLFVVFIPLKFEGLTVTMLWLLVSVIVFLLGLQVRKAAIRLLAVMLMGLTLLKLLAFDSLRFTTIQKVIAYLLLGVLLLVVSFFYQKFRKQLFSDE